MSPMSVYRRILVYFRPFLCESILGVILTFAGIAFNLLRPWPFKFIVDDVLPGKATHATFIRFLGSASAPTALLVLCLCIVAINFLGGLINLFMNIVFVKVGLQALLRLRTDLYAYLHSLPLKFHDSRRSTDSSFRVAYDSQAIQSLYNKSTFIFQSVFTLITTFLVMLRMDWELTLIALCILPIVIFAIYYYANLVRRQSTTIQERESDVLSTVQEGLSSVRMVQAFGREDFEVEQLRLRARESLQANLRLTFTTMKSALVVSTLMALGTAAVYYIGSRHVLEFMQNPKIGISLGSLLVLSTYLQQLYQPIEALTYTVWAMESAAAGATRCFEVLNRADDVPDAPNATAITSTRGEISFENVQFGYDEARLILKNISVRVEPGQTVAFVGGTGAADKCNGL
ncbi:MAG: ABC transporter ATP-binding protein, partial [Verrucomicrobiota bacterium]